MVQLDGFMNLLFDPDKPLNTLASLTTNLVTKLIEQDLPK